MVIDAFYIFEHGTFSSLFPQGPVKRHASKYTQAIPSHKLSPRRKQKCWNYNMYSKKLSNITVLIILYDAVLKFSPLIIIIIPATDKKILPSRIDQHFHRLNMV